MSDSLPPDKAPYNQAARLNRAALSNFYYHWEKRLTGPLIPAHHARLYLALEFTLFFILCPIFLYFNRREFGIYVIPALLSLALFALVMLLRDPEFQRRRLWNLYKFKKHLLTTLISYVLGVNLLTFSLLILRPDLLFNVPLELPGVWLLILVFYPVASVYPQELIYRTFMFHRYRALFPKRRLMVLASGLSFGFAHLFFNNWVAPVLTCLGGLLFARTYSRSGSTLQSSIEHALWGNYMFTIGLGWYFYGGAIQD